MVPQRLSEMEAIKAVDEILSGLNDQEATDRIVRWAFAKYGRKEAPLDSQGGKGAPKKKIKVAKQRKQGKGSTKPKGATLSIVKSLDLKPKSKKNFRDFAQEKNPASIKEKCVVSVYWLLNELGLQQVGLDHIYTCFKEANWRIPKNFRNMLHQTGTAGWLDSSELDNIKMTTVGDNLINHDLPRNDESSSK